jgi:hypothetical protein
MSAAIIRSRPPPPPRRSGHPSPDLVRVSFVLHRPLALVSVLTAGDYLLWDWSLGDNHEIPALAAGLTLPPLGIAFILLLAINVGRLFASTAARSRGKRNRLEASRERRAGLRAGDTAHTDAPRRAAQAEAGGASSSSRIAA